MTPEQTIAKLKAENADLREMNRTQEETIKRAWITREKDRKRIEVQQWIIDKQNREGNAPSAREIAEQIFKEAENG